MCVCVCVCDHQFLWFGLFFSTVILCLSFMGTLFFMLSWMFQHDYFDTCCFECLICMCFVFAPVQRNWACFTWKGALEICSLLLVALFIIPCNTPPSIRQTYLHFKQMCNVDPNWNKWKWQKRYQMKISTNSSSYWDMSISQTAFL